MRVCTGLRVACREDLREVSSQVASALRESQAQDWSTQEPGAVVAEVLRLQSAMEAAVGRLEGLERGAAPDGDESSEEVGDADKVAGQEEAASDAEGDDDDDEGCTIS